MPTDQHQETGTKQNRWSSCWHYDLLPMKTTTTKNASTSRTISPLDSIKYNKYRNVVHQVVDFIVNQRFDSFRFVSLFYSNMFIVHRSRTFGIWTAIEKHVFSMKLNEFNNVHRFGYESDNRNWTMWRKKKCVVIIPFRETPRKLWKATEIQSEKNKEKHAKKTILTIKPMEMVSVLNRIFWNFSTLITIHLNSSSSFSVIF